ncbi:MAG: ATP-binding cassette domain-containing protein [Ruminococcus sp.]|nr:ATP-binding cassette domain-containing protein [Ruminococcus sp.]
MSERTIIPSDHDALVDEHTWDTVQEILDRHTKVKPCTSGYENKFRGILKCADCGSTLMVHTDGRNKEKPVIERTFYQCRIYRVRGTGFCSQHRINADDLEELVLADIQTHAKRVIKNREKFMRKVLGQMDTTAANNRENIQKKLDKTNLMTSETLTGARVIRAFSRQKDEEKEFADNTEELKRQQIIAGRISALMNPATYVIVNFAIIAIIWFGGKTVYSGSISQGEVIALVNYMNQILLALLAMAILVTNITKMQASAIRINDVFAVEPSVSDKNNKPVATDGNAPCVEFRNCFFSYASAEADSLSDISFKVMKGETIGIIGGTGSGKTSLINLIPRFYDVRQGEVLVDGVDVKEYPFSQLRGMIGIVPQKAVLFKGTIRHNMQWRDKNATDEDIWNALDIAQAKDFVEKKPDKLDEMILQEGKNLSGGQRQRLTIARALVGDPEILILDDSASALDLATDARLRKAIHEKTSGMTVFIVSQRISSIKSADKIIVLDDGKIAGIGTHSELYNGCEVYKEICLSQLSEKEAQANG